MKNIIKSLLVFTLVITITGCGKKKDYKDSLTCSGNFLLSMGMIEKTTNEVYNDDLNDDFKSEIVFDSEAGNVGHGEYTFFFDDEKIIKLELKEVLNDELSKDIELDGREEISDGCYAYKKDGKVILECTEGEDSFLANVFNHAGYSNKNDLKEYIEKETTLNCK